MLAFVEILKMTHIQATAHAAIIRNQLDLLLHNAFLRLFFQNANVPMLSPNSLTKHAIAQVFREVLSLITTILMPQIVLASLHKSMENL
jgi:hypothetical protein